MARPLGLSHIPRCDLSEDRWEERRGEAGREGALGWPLTTHWTFPLSLLQRNASWLPTRDVHVTNQAGVSLVGNVCFHWGPVLLWSLLRAHRLGPALGAGLLERRLLDCEKRAALALIIISCLLNA